SGVVLVLVGLGLATVDRLPQTGDEWVGFGGTLTKFGIGFVAAGVAAFTAARYLPNIPYANRLVLTPPGERPDAPEDAAAAYPAGGSPRVPPCDRPSTPSSRATSAARRTSGWSWASPAAAVTTSGAGAGWPGTAPPCPTARPSSRSARSRRCSRPTSWPTSCWR